ncbi:MAG TPA: ABC transporter permease, partial [Gemmatimonadales bacterium]|nr:ABC transporter permease [Gemmatimonadales bacterium]
MEALLQDIRYGIRRLARSPGFTGLGVLVLALGIGGTATAFGVVNAVLLRPLGFPDPGALVRPYSLWRGSRSTASPPDFADWRARSRSFTELAATNSGSFALTGDGPAEQIPGAEVTGGLFSVLGTPPLLGRTLTTADDDPGAAPGVVLGYDLWRRRFGADSGVVGRTVRLEGTSTTVLGVMPPAFIYPDGSELWLPLRFTAAQMATQRGAHYLDVVGRLQHGVTLEAADRELRGIAGALAGEYPRTDANYSATVISLRDALVGDVRTPLLLLLSALGVVLLIACANVAGLLVVRGIAREREIAIRSALGGGRGRLVRTLITESTILAALGGLAGTMIALWGTAWVSHVSGSAIPLLGETRMDGGVLAFIGLVTLCTVVVFGLLPAWQTVAGGALAFRLQSESRGNTGGRLRTRNALVVAQTALAVLLLVGAGLLLKSFVRLQRVDPGFDPRHVLTFGVSLPDASYPTPERSALFYQSLIERVDALPGVRAAGAVFGLPLTDFGYSISALELDGRTLSQEEQDGLSLQIRVVTPGYFAAMGIPVRRGRGILASDREDAPPVMVVNDAAARRIWPDQDPVGHRLTVGTRLGLGDDHARAGGEVVGVIGDLKEGALSQPAAPTMYLSHAQFPMGFMSIAIRTSGDPLLLAKPAQAALAATDPDVPLFRLRSMDQLVAASIAQPRLYALLLAVFALVAITLAAVGLYGVLAQTVAQRERELGVRMALGATARDVVGMVVKQATRLAAVGVVVGLAGGLAATRILATLLFGVKPFDPGTFVTVGIGLFVIAL